MMMTWITTIKHFYQPSGNSCGPTCLYMLAYELENRKNDLPFDTELTFTIQDICDMCGTDWIVGTPPDRMEKGLNALKIKYVEYISPRPYDLLDRVIQDGNAGLLRTITKGVPHWIIAYRSVNEKNSFSILDPWLGKIEYTIKQLDEIWKPRDYQFFEIILNGN